MHQHLAPVRLLDEVVQHPLRDFEVGDDAVFHRTNGDNVPRRAAKHLLGFFADRFDLSIVLVNRDDRRFVDDDALVLHEDEGIGRAEVDGEIVRKNTKQ